LTITCPAPSLGVGKSFSVFNACASPASLTTAALIVSGMVDMNLYILDARDTLEVLVIRRVMDNMMINFVTSLCVVQSLIWYA